MLNRQPVRFCKAEKRTQLVFGICVSFFWRDVIVPAAKVQKIGEAGMGSDRNLNLFETYSVLLSRKGLRFLHP